VLEGFTAGEGPTVLLVHGWSDRAASLGALVAPLVERGFRVVGIDLPGHGDSPGGRTNALEMAATIREIDRELGGVDAIVAHSIGAFVTVLELANGLAPSAVALIAPLVRVDQAIDRFAQQLRLSRGAVKALRAEIEDTFGRDAWERFSTDLAAPGLDTPALIVHDQDDPETLWSDASLLAEAWPGARLLTTRGLGHHRVVRDAGVVDAIVEFTADTVWSSAAASRTDGSR
jgi:pimeloyl-ACP methyl ester carboxylesterase